VKTNLPRLEKIQFFNAFDQIPSNKEGRDLVSDNEYTDPLEIRDTVLYI
jgi:hypothetical protein